MRSISVTLFSVLALLFSTTSAATAAPAARESYIVVLHDGVKSPAVAAAEIAGQVGGQVGFIYEHALVGFSISVPPHAVPALQRNPNVKYVEPDAVRQAFVQTVPTGIRRILAGENKNIGIGSNDGWWVDVDVAVIDTGVDFEHPDLNVAGGVNCTGGGPRGGKCTDGGDDDHYHGTHVAGTIAALDNGIGVVGVAPGARVWAVKVLDKNGSGWSSWIIAGIDWVAKNAATIEVANMSLGGSGYSQAEYDAIQGAVDKGVAFAVAAGNSDADANYYSPAAFGNVLTVSALADFNGQPGGGAKPTCRNDQDDTLADFSNWGSAVDIAAPGVCILSTYPMERGEYGTISGTSMASPHVAGALALLASRNSPNNATDVRGLYDRIIGAGNYNWADDSGDGIKEPLLDVSNTTLFNPALIAGVSGGAPPTNNPPEVNIASPTNGASFTSSTTISFSGSATDAEQGDLTASLVWTSSRDGQVGNGGFFSTATLSDGTHTITASATDSEGARGDDSISITVSSSDGFILEVFAYKTRGTKYADLTWSGARSNNVDVFRTGTKVDTTGNDGHYEDGPLGKGGGSATYYLCEAEMSVCSNSVTVSW